MTAGRNNRHCWSGERDKECIAWTVVLAIGSPSQGSDSSWCPFLSRSVCPCGQHWYQRTIEGAWTPEASSLHRSEEVSTGNEARLSVVLSLAIGERNSGWG